MRAVGAILFIIAIVLLTSEAQAGDWPMFRHDAAHSGVADEVVEPPLGLLWKYQTGSSELSSPAVSGGVVYVGSYDGFVYALDASTGSLKWKYKTGDNVYSSPAVSNDAVYVGSANYVYALDAGTGSLKWKYETNGIVYSSPAVTEGVVYVSSDDSDFAYVYAASYVYALDAGTGSLKWKYKTNGSVRHSSLAVSRGMVYVSAFGKKYRSVSGGLVWVGSDSYVYALDAGTGSLRWKYEINGSVDSSPAVSEGVVYVGVGGAYDSYVHALDASTGSLKWKYRTGWGNAYSSPAVLKGTVYVGSHDGFVYALDSANESLKWKYETTGSVYSSPAVSGGVVYVGSYDGFIYALDASTGSLKWKYKTGNNVYSSPAVAGGAVYVGSRDHNVYAFSGNASAPQPAKAIVSKPAKIAVTMLDYSFKVDEEPPVSVNQIVEYLKVKETLVSGDFVVRLDPVDSIKSVNVEMKLKYIKAGDLNTCAAACAHEEIKSYSFERSGKEFRTHLEEVKWFAQPGELLTAIIGFFSGDSPTKSIIEEMGEDFFSPAEYKVYLTGDEQWYISAEITRVSGIDANGDKFEFTIGKEFDTAFGKLLKETSKDYLYTSVFSPVALSITDSNGRRVGFIEGKTYEEIDGAIYLGSPGSIQVILVSQPKAGDYQITTEGLKKGTFTILSVYSKNGKKIIKNYENNVTIEPGIRKNFKVTIENSTAPPLWILAFVAFIIAAIVVLFIQRKSKGV